MANLKIKMRKMTFTDVCAEWNGTDDECPDIIRISFNGRLETFRHEVQQPCPQVMKTIDLIKIMNRNIYGGYKAKHAKKE